MAENKNKLPFTRTNYIIMLAGILTLLLGFVIMSIDNQLHGFGVLGLTIGPIVVMLGFIIEFVAIFYNPKKNK